MGSISLEGFSKLNNSSGAATSSPQRCPPEAAAEDPDSLWTHQSLVGVTSPSSWGVQPLPWQEASGKGVSLLPGLAQTCQAFSPLSFAVWGQIYREKLEPVARTAAV